MFARLMTFYGSSQQIVSRRWVEGISSQQPKNCSHCWLEHRHISLTLIKSELVHTLFNIWNGKHLSTWDLMMVTRCRGQQQQKSSHFAGYCHRQNTKLMLEWMENCTGRMMWIVEMN
jgi:hypothetical protein